MYAVRKGAPDKKKDLFLTTKNIFSFHVLKISRFNLTISPKTAVEKVKKIRIKKLSYDQGFPKNLNEAVDEFYHSILQIDASNRNLAWNLHTVFKC